MSSLPGMNGQLPPCCPLYADSLMHLCAPFKSSNRAKINSPKSYFHIKVPSVTLITTGQPNNSWIQYNKYSDTCDINSKE